jgi:hypothetical protein
MSENSSALNGMAPSAVRLTKALWLLEKQMFPALTRRSNTSEYLRRKSCINGYTFNKETLTNIYLDFQARREKKYHTNIKKNISINLHY